MTYSAAVQQQLDREAAQPPATTTDAVEEVFRRNSQDRHVEAPERPFRGRPGQVRKRVVSPRSSWRTQIEHEVVAGWAKHVPSTKLAAARQALREACDVAEAKGAALLALDGDKQLEQRAIEAAAAREIETGQAEDIVSSDWTTVEARRSAAWSASYDLAFKASRAYIAIQQTETPAALPGLIKLAAEKRAKAAKALRAAEDELKEAAALSRAIRDAATDLKLVDPSWSKPDADLRALPAAAVDGIAAARRFAEADDDYTSGAVFVADDGVLPDYRRRGLLNKGTELAIWSLAQIELIEGYAVTDYTRAEAKRDEIVIDPDFVSDWYSKQRIPE